MAQSINLGVTAVPAGTRVFNINGLPGTSEGFELILGAGSSWVSKSGLLFDLLLEISLDNTNYQPWLATSVDGGQVFNKEGSNSSTWFLQGFWPGEYDGPDSRRKLRGTDIRITLTVAQTFTVDSVVLRTV